MPIFFREMTFLEYPIKWKKTSVVSVIALNNQNKFNTTFVYVFLFNSHADLRELLLFIFIITNLCLFLSILLNKREKKSKYVEKQRKILWNRNVIVVLYLFWLFSTITDTTNGQKHEHDKV